MIRATKANPFAGLWSIVATLGTVCFLAYHVGDVSGVFEGVKLLISGHVLDIPKGNGDFAIMLTHMVVVVALALPCAVGGLLLAMFLLGKPTGEEISKQLMPKDDVPLFKTFFIIMILEECFARLLFLRVIPSLFGLTGATAFYLLFLMGNGLWALIHILNFKKAENRHPLRTLPQFVAGVFFTYMFVRFGFLAALLTHTVYNAVLFTLGKTQRTNWVDIVVLAYSAAIAWVSFRLMDKPLADVLQLLAADSNFTIKGWVFWDYTLLAIFSSSFMSSLASLFLYDQVDLSAWRKLKERKDSGKHSGASLLAIAIGIGIVFALVALFSVAMMYFGIWALGFLMLPLNYRAVVFSIYACFGQKASSPSALSRTIFTSIPAGFVSISVVQALGFFPATAYLLVSILLFLPLVFFKAVDD